MDLVITSWTFESGDVLTPVCVWRGDAAVARSTIIGCFMLKLCKNIFIFLHNSIYQKGLII